MSEVGEVEFRLNLKMKSSCNLLIMQTHQITYMNEEWQKLIVKSWQWQIWSL